MIPALFRASAFSVQSVELRSGLPYLPRAEPGQSKVLRSFFFSRIVTYCNNGPPHIIQSTKNMSGLGMSYAKDPGLFFEKCTKRILNIRNFDFMNLFRYLYV